MKKWVAKSYDKSIIDTLAKETSINPLCAEVLVSRGMTSAEQVVEFIQPNDIEDPMVMADMDKAVELINDSIEQGLKVCIFGDYDCDGITSTAMLKTYLECIGADVFTYIPEREEGYGMNIHAIDVIHEQGANLIITVDNGISAHAESEHIYELGMKLIITDHHQPSETLPKADAIVNPHRQDCPSKFKNLCGAGVVFKLIMAMENNSYDAIIEQFGDLVTIATIGDVVEISGENRKLVYDGLNYVKHTDRVGLLALCEVANINLESINSTRIAFGIVPRVNASGRFGSPKLALELLTCEDEDEAYELSRKLCDLNTQRKETENEIMGAIELQIDENPNILNQRVLVFVGDNFHHGVIGIVASRVCEKYDKPCFIITNEGENSSRGSARGVGNFSVFKCLEYCAEVLERYGGHKGAGGFSLLTENVEKFKSLILQYAQDSFSIMPRTPYYIDKILLPSDITLDNVKSLQWLEPFGEGNREPTFLISGAVLKDTIPMAKNTSVKFRVLYHGKYLDIVQFRKSLEEVFLRKESVCDFLVKLSLNTFNGRESITVMALDYRLSGLVPSRFFSALDTYEKFLVGVELPKEYYERITPTYEELKVVYSYMAKLNPIDVETLFLTIKRDNINYCKLRLSIDIFCELGLATFDANTQSVGVIKTQGKVDLESSSILRRLKTLC